MSMFRRLCLAGRASIAGSGCRSSSGSGSYATLSRADHQELILAKLRCAADISMKIKAASSTGRAP